MAKKLSQSKPVQWGEVAPPRPFHALYRSIGEIAFVFADLEKQLIETISTMLGTSWQEAAAIEDLMQSLNQRIELFYILAVSGTFQNPLMLQTPDQVAKATLREMGKAIYKDLKTANDDRNNLIHGAWTGFTPDACTFSKDRLKAQDGKLAEIPVRGISTKLLKEEARFIISVTLRLVDWQSRYKARERPDFWPAPLPAKHILQSPLKSVIKANRTAAEKVQRPPLLP